MKTLKYCVRNLGLLALVTLQLFFYQNCGGGMESLNSSVDLSSGLGNGPVDTTPPMLMFLTPQPSTYLKTPFKIQGTCEDGLDVKYALNQVATPSTAICNQSLFSIDVSTLADGVHQIEVSQSDAAGNKGTSNLSFKVDKTAPAPMIAMPAANATLTVVGFNVSGSCESNLPVVIAGTALAAPVSVNCTAGAFQTAVTGTGTNGTASITVEQTDLADNKGSSSRSVVINLSSTVPVVKITSPAANLLTNVRALNLAGTCESGLTVTVAGAGTAPTSAVCSSGKFGVPIALTAGDGLKAVTVSQKNAKNEVGQDARSFQLDMTGPTLTIASPAAGAKAEVMITLAGACETGLPVSITGAGVAAPSTLNCAMNMYQGAVNFSANLGVKTISLSQADAAGNKTTVTRDFERIAPPVVVLDGQLLYANNCAGCHNALASSTKLGRTSTQITLAISNINEMKFLKLTAPEVSAIASALEITAPPPAQPLPTLPLPAAIPAANTSALYAANAFGVSDMRRLTRAEVVNSVRDILTVAPPTASVDSLPEDLSDEAVNPFDNDTSLQSVSLAAIEGYDKFAEAVSADIQGRTALINTLAGCTPNGVSDSACFGKFVSNVARLFLRREITSAEQTRFAALLTRSTALNNYYVAPALLVQALIMSPEFLYRVEVGTTIVGSTAKALTNYEIATRMSYLAWGSAPDKALLDAAAAGSLKTEASRVSQMQRLLSDNRAKNQAYRFHTQWLGYGEVGLPATGTLASDMKQETNKLLENILFTSTTAKWLDIFTSNQTYVTPALATHYGMSAPASPGWVNYTGVRGGGILAHGQFLAQGAKFGDTSPTLRGYRILKRVFCQKFGPVPVGVDPDNPPPSVGNSNCKNDTYNMRYQAACTGCHALTDNIGFGLENYSPWGQWRITEPNRPTCTVKADGSVGTALFSGPKELGALVANQPLAAQCASRQLLRYALGRADEPTDASTIAAMHAQYNQTPQFSAMLQSIVRSQAFVQK
ncbi:MAG: DUF1592 domain-containing protein [Bdellovibrionota bacterium]